MSNSRYLSEIEGLFAGYDVNTGEPLQLSPRNAESKLNGGFGFKTSFKVIKKFDDVNVFAEPFFEFWRLEKTKPEQAHSEATNGRNYVSVFPDRTPYEPLFEPLSYSREFGLRLGIQF
jgi:hypothetical protein